MSSFRLGEPRAHLRIPASGGVYRIRCEVTGARYYGSTNNLRRRAAVHVVKTSDERLRRWQHPNPNITASVRKHGQAAHHFDVLALSDDKNDRLRLEAVFIERSRHPVMNIYAVPVPKGASDE